MKKRIFLLYPPVSKEERYGSALGASGGNQIPLGIYYLSSALRNAGFTIKAYDAEIAGNNAEATAEMIRDFLPDAMGISCTTVAYHRAVEVARIVKKNLPQLPIVIGGPHVTSNYTHAMSFSCFDYGVVGEGEETAIELFHSIFSNNPLLSSIKGIVFRKDGELLFTGHRALIDNLDTIAFPAYDLIKNISQYNPPPSNYKKLPVVNIITSRGCPNHCTFCDRAVFGNKLRQRSAENVVEEISLLVKKYNVKEIAFVDDTFTIGKNRLIKIFNLLEKRKIRITWTCMSRVNTVDRELLHFLKQHGCWHISFGIESGSQKILNMIKKGITLEMAEKAVKECASTGIRTKGFFMIGHPGETMDTINDTISFALKIPLDTMIATINTPHPGTEQYSDALKFGTVDETDWSKWSNLRPVFVPHGLSEKILLKKHQELYRRFYLRPRIIFFTILSFFSISGIRRFSALLRSSLYMFKN